MPKLTLDELTEAAKGLTTEELDRLVDRAKIILSLRPDDLLKKRGRPVGSRNRTPPLLPTTEENAE